MALDLRSNFGISLIGIHRQGKDAPEWFPKASVLVSKGDLGLVVRQPHPNGGSRPTVTDEELAPLMNAEEFSNRIRQGVATPSSATWNGLEIKPGDEIILRQKNGHPTVRAYNEPNSNPNEVKAQIPNGEVVKFLDEHGHYLKVKWKDVE